jgi:hypothetical protein
VKAKTTTVMIPGTDRGSRILTMAPALLQPSTIACSSMSLGIALKKLMRSHVQNGTVKVG